MRVSFLVLLGVSSDTGLIHREFPTTQTNTTTVPIMVGIDARSSKFPP